MILFLLSFSIGQSQQARIGKATNEFKDFGYIKTSEILHRVAEKGYKSPELFQKLGDSYYFNNQMVEAAKWYGELMALNSEIDSEYYFRYAQALKSLEKYSESDKWMLTFYEHNKEDNRSQAFINHKDYLASIVKKTNSNIKLSNLNINTPYSDFGSAVLNNELFFASSRGTGKKYAWNDQPFLDLYAATKVNDSTYENVKGLNGKINTKYHESSVAFLSDSILFFTRNNFYNKKYKSDENKTNQLKIFKAEKDKNGWDLITSVPFNNDNYSVAHPTINTKRTKMYFASDMPGGKGLSDLYVVDINADGSFGNPINLGDKINTEGQESFPFISANGDLYFSSNGYPGLGGLDVYVIRNMEDKLNSLNSLSVENIGKPINSSQDDFAFFTNKESYEGFVTSNRPGGKGDDDIYSFSVQKCVQQIEGVIKDKKSLETIAMATVSLVNEVGVQVASIASDSSGKFNFEVNCNESYVIRGGKETYLGAEKHITIPQESQKLTYELLLDQDVHPLKPGVDLAKVLDIPIIYFDFDKSNIRYDATVELQKVLEVLQQYPTIRIDVRSHTDCRGSAVYNKQLSEKRAQSTRQYLISKGINAKRLTAKGYGESQLINDCGCEPTNVSNCSEAEHQLNRRSEFIIISME